MNKIKVVSLLMALVMLMSVASVAFADDYVGLVNSKKLEDLEKPPIWGWTVDEDGNRLYIYNSSDYKWVDGRNTKLGEAIDETDIGSHGYTDDGTTAIENTGDKTKAAIAEVLAGSVPGSLSYFPASIQARILACGNVSGIAEIFPITLGGGSAYDSNKLTANTFRWAVSSALKGKAVVVVLGVETDTGIIWYPVPATVVSRVGGYPGSLVQFSITDAIFKARPTLLAVLV
ncbi:hypothetical protein FACS1894184_06460 [Clostridia bacterium]|nr:hypothetical protein FACS1894184_06460 [Clostridia bacterium]